MATSKAKLSDFKKQTNNVNCHKPRGMGMLDSVIAKDGWQSAITVANDNQVFAGSARLEVAQERFGNESEPIVVDIDGTRPVILRRTDIPNVDDPRAVRLGVADNRISEINYDPDIELLNAIADDVDISDMYFDDELAAIVDDQSQLDHQEPDFLRFEDNNNIPAYASDRSAGSKLPIPIVVGSGTMKRWNEYKESIGIKNDTVAFETLLEFYENE